jgi:2-polyprenyl-6-methoxyphenol hydroxylase-like FAD-dependent oxidoreductase
LTGPLRNDDAKKSVVSNPDDKRVIVLGAGMAGLATALAFKGSGRQVLLLERDEPAVVDDPKAAFEHWQRPGVPQVHHTHIFLGRLRNILRDRHPELLEALYRAGLHSAGMEEVLPPGQIDGYQPLSGDDDLLHLWGRRATFEYVLRQHVLAQEHVEIRFGVRVEGLVVQRDRGQLRVTGVEIKQGGASEMLSASVIVDSLGQHSKCIDQLRGQGAKIKTYLEPSACAYYCRHFALNDTAKQNRRGGTGTNIDYLIAGLFFAEADTFSIAFTCREDDEQLKATLRSPEGFDRVCNRIPGLARWTEHAEPITRVLGGAGLKNRWQHFPNSASAQVLGYFPVGDSHIQTNPIYGRGCSMAFVQAHVLADALAKEPEPARQSQRYFAEAKRQLKVHFQFCVTGDQTFWARTKRASGDPLEPRDRLLLAAYDVVIPTIDQDRNIAREWLRGQQMLEASPPARVLATFWLIGMRILLGVLSKRKPLALAPPPERDALIEATAPSQAP